MTTEADKVEMEQVPLKTDTDEKPAATEEAAKAAPPKKTWFFQKDKKKAAAAAAAGEGEAADEPSKDKKKCFWSRCSKPAGEEGEKQAMSIGIDMQMRDERALNDHVKLQFEDVFGEPDAFHSWDCAWRCVYRVFEFTRTFFYRLVALLICLPAALVFGVAFGLLSALNVFCIVPAAKLASIPLAWISMTWAFIVRNVLDPLTRSLGLCFSNMHVRKYGINNAPTDLMQA